MGRTFPIPDSIPSANAAPMLCAGITLYSPLVRNGAGPTDAESELIVEVIAEQAAQESTA